MSPIVAVGWRGVFQRGSLAESERRRREAGAFDEADLDRPLLVLVADLHVFREVVLDGLAARLPDVGLRDLDARLRLRLEVRALHRLDDFLRPAHRDVLE